MHPAGGGMSDTPVWEPPAWQDHAACRAEDPELFFPPRGADASRNVARAIEICKGCPVRVACLMYAQQNGEQWGVWGARLFEPKSCRRRRAS